jgi:hypothetical protein
MRQLCEIISDLKEGKTVDYEEARLSCLVLSDLLFLYRQDAKILMSDNKLAMSLVKQGYEGMPDGMSKTYWNAMKSSPEEFLGNRHPDHPKQIEEMGIALNILNHVAKLREQQGKSPEKK